MYISDPGETPLIQSSWSVHCPAGKKEEGRGDKRGEETYEHESKKKYPGGF